MRDRDIRNRHVSILGGGTGPDPVCRITMEGCLRSSNASRVHRSFRPGCRSSSC
jgi:hypothetical protein